MGERNFTWANQRTEEQMRARQGTDLFKLEAGKGHHVVFAQVAESRQIVGVHWIKALGRSCKCLGSDDCAHCLHKEPLSFHLYALAFISVPVPFPAIIDLATTNADKITKEGLDTTCVYRVSRNDARGPIFLVRNEHMKVDVTGYQGWDITNDVNRIYRGRISPSRKDLDAIIDIVRGGDGSADSPLEPKRKGSKR